MFETILADILNRYLKPYVKKLDTSQLRLGIWKGKMFQAPLNISCEALILLIGDVCLENLELKEDIFVCISICIRINARNNNMHYNVTVIRILIF